MEKKYTINESTIQEKIKSVISQLRGLEKYGVLDITVSSKPRVHFTRQTFLKNFNEYTGYEDGEYIHAEYETEDFIAVSLLHREKTDEKVEALISKIDDLMEKETDPKRKEGLFEAYAELLKVR